MSKNVLSPGYPDEYCDNLNCTTVFTIDHTSTTGAKDNDSTTQVLRFSFNDFQLERRNNYFYRIDNLKFNEGNQSTDTNSQLIRLDSRK